MFVLTLTAVTGACADERRGDELRISTRDSAGVRIVEIDGDPWGAPTWATLDTTDVLRIVPDDSKPETLFGRVRGVLRLSDGSIAVLDIGRHRILRFAADGSFIRSIGRQGQGPGELDQPWRLVRAPADTVSVYDMAGHLEMFPPGGEGARRVRLPWGSEVGTAQILGSFRSGGYLAIMNEFPGKVQPGANPLFSTLHVMTAAGVAGPSLGRHQSTSFTFREGTDGRLRQVATLFWAEPGMAVLPSGYVWCLSTTFDCQIWSNTGTHLRTIRASVSTPAVDDAKVAELETIQLSSAQSAADTARVRADIVQADRMDRIPVLSLIRTDTLGRIWMRPYVWRPADTTARWLVFESGGEVLGTVTTPASLQVFEIGEDYILGVERDEDDAEGVVMYRFKAE
jgi:hypothetical protein